MNLAADVLATAAANPDKVALVVMGRTGAERWSFGRLAEAVHGMAGALADRAPPGARVLLRLGNGPRFPVAFLGAAAAGLVPVPSATALTGPEITALARRLNPALILADPAVALPDHPAAVFRDLDAMMAAPPMAPVLGDPDRPGYIVFTSGSGGVPRAVVHAHRAIRARRAMWDGWYGLTPNDRVCHAGAFNWTFTLGAGLMDPWAAGATALVPGPDVPVSALPLLLKRFEATIFAAVPGVFRKLLASDLPHLPRLRHGLTAGERLPAALRTDWRAATGADIHEALGMSECSTFISGSPDRPAPEGRVGYVQQGRRVAVLDEAGGVVAPGSIGRLAVHRSEPGLMLGYLQEDGSARLPLEGAYFITGDRVEVAEDGAIGFAGRADELLNAGGFRIAPQEIEAALGDAQGLTECAAFEVEVKPGTRILALAYAGQTSQAALKALAAARLAVYKHPRLYLLCERLPRGPNGKLARSRLAALAQEHLT